MITEWEMLLRACISILLGFCIGLERKMRFKEAGIRTHTIVCFGSALMMDKYFISRGDVETSATKDGVIISDTTGGTEKIEFINEVPFSTFRFAFSLQTSGTVDSVSIKLTDYYDLSKTMEITSVDVMFPPINHSVRQDLSLSLHQWYWQLRRLRAFYPWQKAAEGHCREYSTIDGHRLYR